MCCTVSQKRVIISFGYYFRYLAPSGTTSKLVWVTIPRDCREITCKFKVCRPLAVHQFTGVYIVSYPGPLPSQTPGYEARGL